MTAEATLAALDWKRVTCQSPHGCTRAATLVVAHHAVDTCNGPDTDPFGNIVEILCDECLVALAGALVRMYVRGRLLACLTCGRPIKELSDILSKENDL